MKYHWHFRQFKRTPCDQQMVSNFRNLLLEPHSSKNKWRGKKNKKGIYLEIITVLNIHWYTRILKRLDLLVLVNKIYTFKYSI